MTSHSVSREAGRPPLPLALPFPQPSLGLRTAYRDLDAAMDGADQDIKGLGNANHLPRPWDPATIDSPALRHELWQWLEAVVTWINTEYTWHATTMIPPCWPLHPHLVHEIAVLADQRYKAGLAVISDPLDDWHRHGLPTFQDRMHTRIRTACEDGHQPWPAKGRFARHRQDTDRRLDTYQLDSDHCLEDDRPEQPKFTVIDGQRVDTDTDTGEAE